MVKGSRKRTRPTRVDPRTARPGGQGSWLTRLRQDRNWLRMLVLVGLSAALVVLVHWRGVPFAFRLGQRVDRDVHVKVTFRKKNVTKTNNLREDAARTAPPVLRRDPARVAALQPLEQHLVELVHTLALATSWDKLDSKHKRTWNLTAKEFEQFRKYLAGPLQEKAMVTAVQEALSAVRARGVLAGLDEEELGKQYGRLPATAKIVSPDDPGRPTWVNLDDVRIESLTKPDGPLGRIIDQQISARAVSDRLVQWISERLEPSLRFDVAATVAERERAASLVEDWYDQYKPGDVLVRRGTPINDEQLALLELEHRAYAVSRSASVRVARVGSIACLVSLVVILSACYVRRYQARLSRSTPRVTILSLLAIVTVALARLFSLAPWYAELIPVSLAVMIVTIAYSQRLALLLGNSLAVLVALGLGASVGRLLVLCGTATAAALALGRIRHRTTLIKVGTVVGLVASLLTVVVGLLDVQSPAFLLENAVRALACGLIAGFFISGSLPFVEHMFGIMTDISLLELSDVSHPLMQQLVQQAPGTYSHCNAVASLAESAAESVGAHALLCKVGAFFHDIGKTLKPHYFIENQADALDRHRALAPAMSTLIIIGHVKDGVDLARQNSLPEPIVRFIEEHHGTMLVQFFYHAATQSLDESKQEVSESAFRYPGPKPATRETAIVMLADAVESATRTLSEPTPGRIENLVDKLAMQRLMEGQFDNSGLTLTELRQVQRSLVKSVTGIYHGRVRYPQQETA